MYIANKFWILECIHTFFKNGELDYTNAATVVSLTNEKDVVNYQIIKYFECPICKLMCKITRSICGSQLTRVAVEFALNQVCALIAGPFRSSCDEIIHKSINQMADLIIKYADDAAVCKFLHFCVGDAEIIREIEMEQPNEFETFDVETIVKRKFDCPICKAVVSGLKALVKSDYSQDKIKDALTKVCSKVHKFGEKCQHFVKAYSHKMIELLTNAATRGKVCKILKLCPAADDDLVLAEEAIFIDDVEMGFIEVDLESFAPELILDVEFSNLETIDKKKVDCPICKAVVSGIKALVKSDFSQNKIRDALTKVCSKLHKFGSKCQHFVDTYAGKLVELLTNAATRGKVCRLIKLCAVDDISEPDGEGMGFAEVDIENAPKIDQEQIFAYEVADLFIPEPNDVKIGECILCRGIVKAVKEIVKHSFTKDQVKRALSKACSKIHSDHCQSFVNKHFNQLVDLISNGSKRGKVCKIIRVCSAGLVDEVDMQTSFQNDQSLLAEVETRKKKFDCPICKAVVSGIKALVKSDYSQIKIKHALTKVCSKLHKFGSKCQHFVDAYAGKLVELLMNAANRGKVCKLLKLCTADDTDEPNEEEWRFADVDMGNTPKISREHISEYELADNDFLVPNDVKIGECILCKGIVKAVKEIVKHSFTKDQVKRALSKACSKIHSDHCQSFVNKHFNQLVDLISNGSKRGKVCKIIRVCSAGLVDEVDMQTSFQNYQNLLSDDEILTSDPESVDIGSVEFDIDTEAQITQGQILDSDLSEVETGKKKFDCPICKAVNKIKDALTKVCSKLHKFGSKCQHFVDAYAGKLVELLTNAATRGKVCKLLKVCAAVSDEAIFIPELYGEKIGFAEVDMENVLEQIFLSNSLALNHGLEQDECPICKKIVQLVLEEVRRDVTKKNIQNIIEALEHICKANQKAWIYCSTLLKIVQKGSDQFASLIANIKTRNNACAILKLCLSEDIEDPTVMEKLTPENSVEKNVSTKKDKVCNVCEIIVFSVIDLTKRDPTNKTKIEDALEIFQNWCHIRSEDPACPTYLNILDKYFNKFVILIQVVKIQRKTCNILNLCPGNQIVAHPYPLEELHDVQIGECLICKGVVKVVEEVVKHSRTREHIKKALGEACHKLHFRHCERFVQKHLNQLLELILKATRTNKICRLIKICSIQPPTGFENDDITELSNNVFKKDHDECFICQATVFGVVQIVKQGFTKEKIRHVLTALKLMCEVHRKDEADCPIFLNFLKKHSEKLIDLIADDKSRFKACSILKVCPGEGLSNYSDWDLEQSFVLNLLAQNTQQVNQSFELDLQNVGLEQDECPICKKIVQLVLEEVRRDVTKKNIQNIIEALEHICKANQKAWIYCSTLLKIVQKGSEQFASLIANIKTRNKACAMLKLCLSGDIEDPTVMEKLTPEESVEKSVSTKKDKVCNVCEFIVFSVIDLTKRDPTNKTKIEDALEIFQNWCHIRSEDPACPTYLNILNKYFDKLVILIQVVKIQRKTCNILSLCPGNQIAEHPYPLEVSKKDHDECFICQATVFGVVQIVKQGFTKEKIRHVLIALKLMCEVHRKDEADCPIFLNFLKKHSEKLIDLIADDKSRFKACSILKVCPGEGLSNYSDWDLEQSFVLNLMAQNTQQLNQSFEQDLQNVEISICQSCEFSLSMMKTFAQNPHIVALVHEQLTKLCDLVLVSPELRNICHDQINVHWTALINHIRKLHENQICHTLKMCSTPHKEFNEFKVAKVGTSMCNLCQMSLSLMKSLAQNQHFAALIHDTLDNGCKLLVNPYMISMCHSEIRTHWLTWLGIMRNFKEAQVCQTIKMCTKVQIYGVNANNERCESCKAISHLAKIMFKMPSFSTRIHTALNEICDTVSLGFRAICHRQIKVNWKKWMTLLQTIPDERLCRKVDMCP